MGSKNSTGRREVRLRTVLTQPGAGSATAPAAAAPRGEGPPPVGRTAGVSGHPSLQPRPTLVAATPHGTEKVMAIDRARIFVQTDTNPFECSICLNLYNDGENIPTTFPCGHSVCLVHVTEIRRCPLCRGAIPPLADCRPTIALRDASMLFAQVTAEAMALCQEDDDGDEPRDGEEVMLKRESSWELADLQIDHHQASSSSGDFAQRLQRNDAPPPAVAATASGRNAGDVASDARQAQVTRDAALAREMYSREQQERAAQLARDEELARQLQRREQEDATPPVPLPIPTASNSVPPGRFRPTPAVAAAREAAATGARAPPRLLTCDQCGKSCFLCARLKKCCACLDQRPVHDHDGTYPVYVDGVGWQNIGRRSAGYCPACS